MTENAIIEKQSVTMVGYEPRWKMLVKLCAVPLSLVDCPPSNRIHTSRAVWIGSVTDTLISIRTHLEQRAQAGNSLLHFLFPFLQFQQTCEAIKDLSAISNSPAGITSLCDSKKGRG